MSDTRYTNPIRKGQGATGTNNVIGAASAVASMIPGVGPIAGLALGLLPQVASWIFGSDNIDYEALKKRDLAQNQAVFDSGLRKGTEQANKSFNATIGQTTNAQGMASGVAGMSGQGRINAQTYANVAENRDNAVTGLTNGLTQNLNAANMATIRDYSQLGAQQEQNAPTALTYLENFTNSMKTPVMQEGVGALIGGIGKGAGWLGNLFKSGAQNTTNPTMIQGKTAPTVLDQSNNIVGTNDVQAAQNMNDFTRSYENQGPIETQNPSITTQEIDRMYRRGISSKFIPKVGVNDPLNIYGRKTFKF